MIGNTVLEAAHITHEFKLQRLRPMLFGQKREHSAGCRSRVVHQNIDAPESIDKSLGIGWLGQIRRYGDNFAVCLARNLRRRCLERRFATRADRDIDTLASQAEGDRLANPSTPARDECRLPVQSEIHEDSLALNTAMKIYHGLQGAISC